MLLVRKNDFLLARLPAAAKGGNMRELILEPTASAQWHALLTEAENCARIVLPEALKSYLIFLLTRFATDTRLPSVIAAEEFLATFELDGQQRQEKLRDVGDTCLLFAGLFPQRAEKRRVKISYFVELGQSSYCVLSQLKQTSLAQLFAELSHSFVAMMDVLLNCRQLPPQLLSPFAALELWQDTGSQFAEQALHKLWGRDVVLVNGNQKLL